SIGLEDDFISMGGDSYRAMKAARRCRQAGIGVSTVDILSEATVAGLARSLKAKKNAVASSGTGPSHDDYDSISIDNDEEPFFLNLHELRLPPDINPDNIAYAMPCTPMQEDYYHLFSAELAPERPGIMTSCYEITRRAGLGTVDPYRAARAWQAMADHHHMLRTRFVPLAELGVASGSCGPLPPKTVMQLVMRRWPLDCAVIRVDSDSEHDLRQYSEVHTANMMYRAKPATNFSVRLFVTPTQRVYMNLVLWHISADFVSTGIFRADFDRFYRGVLPTRPAPGFDLYVHDLGLATRRGQTAVDSDSQYWINYLTGAEPCWLQPQHLGVVDRRPSQSSAYLDPDGKELTSVTNLGRASCRLRVTGPAAAYCRRCRVLSSTILRFVYALTLWRYTGQKDVCFSYLISDRDRDIPNIEGIFGMIMTYLYARIEVVPSARLTVSLQKLHRDDLVHRRHLLYRPADVARSLGHDKLRDHSGVLPVTNVRFNDRRLDIPQGLELDYRGVLANLVQEARITTLPFSFPTMPLTVMQLFVSLIVVPEWNEDWVTVNITYKRVLFSEESMQRFADTYADIFYAVASGACDTVADVIAHIEKEIPNTKKSLIG
ncbi:uncharacterized protein GLRG_11882, partial [Colletotrichum graminicola M1.001]